MFCGSTRRVIKALTYEGDGFVLITKRLDDGMYPWPATPEEVRELSREDYEILMNGFKVGLMKKRVVNAKFPTENIFVQRMNSEEFRITA